MDMRSVVDVKGARCLDARPNGCPPTAVHSEHIVTEE
jgi:hypothetical protein